MTQLESFNAPPIVESAPFRCVSCGYDLSGTVIGGQCPECGARVVQSLRALEAGEKTSQLALWSMIVGILGIAVCGIAGPPAIIMGYMARNAMRAGGYSRNSQGFATTGIILGIISTALTVLGLALFGLMALFGW